MTGSIDLDAEDPLATCLRDHWTEQAAWMIGCSSIVDVGSGPAVLARSIHAMHGNGTGPRVWTCIDSASIPASAWTGLPFAVIARDGEDFSAALPSHGPVDALVSNFGLEYVARDGLAAACQRWLAPAGRMSCVIHAKDSLIDSTSEQGAADLVFALNDLAFFAHASQLLSAMASAPTDPMARMMHAVDIRDAYNNAVNLLKGRMEDRGARSAVLMDILQGVHALTRFVAAGHLEEALAALANREAAYRAELVRLNEMRHSAQSQAQIDDLMSQLQGLGFTQVECRSLYCSLGSVAWTLSARAPS
jgi:hypothetical protein